MERTERAIYVSALAIIVTAAICTSVIAEKLDAVESATFNIDQADVSGVEFALDEIQSALEGSLDVRVTNTVDVSGTVDVNGPLEVTGEIEVSNWYDSP